MDLTKVSISKKDAQLTIDRSGSTDAKLVAQAVLNDKHLIDIRAVMRDIGVDSNKRPMLAIAQADADEVEFEYQEDDGDTGIWEFSSRGAPDILIPSKGLPRVTEDVLCAVLPPVPDVLSHLKKKDDMYILWEAQWRVKPIDDPYLIRRIGDTMLFIVEEQWDLTDIERMLLG